MDNGPVKILYIGGYGRSGSTLLGRVLGESPRAMCVGETRYVWSRGLIDNVACGCGQPFRSCPFWRAVGEEAFGGWDQINAEQFTEIDRVTNLMAALPFYLAPWLRPRLRDAIDEYVTSLTSLYGAISRVSEGRTIVEISKDPTFASLLIRMQGPDVRILHLVRDSRAVAYSWTRKRREPSPISGQEFMDQISPTRTARSWVTWNTAFHALSLARPPYLKLTYEGFIADPRGVLEKLSSFAGQDLTLPESQLTSSEAKLGDHHIFSGNPMRTAMGWLPLRLDNEWQTRLPRAHLAKVTAITLPLLRIYGYPIAPPGRKTRA